MLVAYITYCFVSSALFFNKFNLLHKSFVACAFLKLIKPNSMLVQYFWEVLTQRRFTKGNSPEPFINVTVHAVCTPRRYTICLFMITPLKFITRMPNEI